MKKEILRKCRRRLIFLIVLFITLEISFLYINRQQSIFIEQKHLTIKEEQFNSPKLLTTFNFSEEYKTEFLSLIPQIKDHFTQKYNIESAIKIRELLLNQSGKERKEPIDGDPKTLLLALKNGNKLLCDPLATLYAFTLHSLGFKVRKIYYSRSLFDPYDTHTVVEVWDQERKTWNLSDPTFNLSIKNNNHFLSVSEIFNLVHSGKLDTLSIKFGSKTEYQSDFKSYYINYFSLMDNISLVQVWYYSKDIYRLPPFKWFSEQYYTYILDSSQFPIKSHEVEIVNLFSFILIVFLPVSITILITIYLIFLARSIIFKKP